MPLLFVPMVLGKIIHFSLLDSGASDSFISLEVAQEPRLKLLSLKYTIKVRVVN